MSTVQEAIQAIEIAEQRRAARSPRSDMFARFYRSAAWAKCKYNHLKTLPRPLRCACCGVTAADARLVLDHVIPLRLPNGSLNPEGWAKRLQGPFQVLCNEHNYICKARSDDDWRADKIEDRRAT
jgi:hypothetical protein